MKKLTLSLLLLGTLISGCSSEDANRAILEEKARQLNSDVDNLEPGCQKLAKCMGATASIVHFTRQKHAPFACELIKGKEKIWLYPDSNLGFGSFESRSYENAVRVCDFINHVGEYSPEARASLKRMFEELEKEKRERLEAERKQKEEKERNKLPIKEVQ